MQFNSICNNPQHKSWLVGVIGSIHKKLTMKHEKFSKIDFGTPWVEEHMDGRPHTLNPLNK